MGFSGKTAKISSVVAAICILTYIAAIAYGAIKIVTNMGERRNLAETEFNDLAERATSSSVYLGFLSEAYRQAIRDYLNACETLSGVIITGTSGEYAFERQSGDTITWVNGSPRFKTGLVFSGGPLYLPLRIDGQRNVTIQAVYNYLDYNLVQRTLRDVLLIILAALLVALLSLILELFLKKKAERSEIFENDSGSDDSGSDEPEGLYTSRGNITRESYTAKKLSSELKRCASSKSDLVFMAIELKDIEIISDTKYSLLADEAVNFFITRDLVFDKGDNGIAVIMPNTDLEQGISQAEEFHRRVTAKLPEPSESDLYIGLSSRSKRHIDAGRLMLEAFSALEKAFADPFSRVVAFKSDPEKYREFIKSHR
ncbi:MAG: GGDEF domain-containing protein [Treponema sp.]|nr:GGDEF domain-containing protein [Treponema sp.]